jgi:prevent-host-death family protein
MKRASVTDAKNNPSALIDSVKSGSPILITGRSRPVAHLEPLNDLRRDDDGRLARLVRKPSKRRRGYSGVSGAPSS